MLPLPVLLIARITGTVVSTAKIEDLEGLKLMVVHPINPDGKLKGKQIVAVDTVQAGVGDDVPGDMNQLKSPVRVEDLNLHLAGH